jgi:hypothetical protein
MSNNEETSITLEGDWTLPETEPVINAWFSALAIEHKLPDFIRYMDGMSGKKYRYFINNLIGSLKDPRYLEIGSWKGSTACSAMWDNFCRVLCIENWSHFGGPKNEFQQNVNASLSGNIKFDFIESNYRDVDYSKIGKFNVYLFDGPHEEHEQFHGIEVTQPALDDTYILIVDDWNWNSVRKGTMDAISNLNSTILASIVIRTTDNESHPQISGQNSDWHNGYFIGVIKK